MAVCLWVAKKSRSRVKLSRLFVLSRKRIIMWEKNGLRHGEFDLFNSQSEQVDESASRVLNIKWNTNSKAVAVEVAQG